VTEIPDVRYAKSGEASIAYQVVGDGPTDVVFVRGCTGDLLSVWDQPLLVRHLEGLASNGRLLMLDKRGTGLSDRVPGVPTIETRMDDVRAVMDAERSRSPGPRSLSRIGNRTSRIGQWIIRSRKRSHVAPADA
jgi:hypothetical protein